MSYDCCRACFFIKKFILFCIFCCHRFPDKKYSTRLTDKQKLALQRHAKFAEKIAEQEQLANAIFEREMTKLRDELTSKMAKLTLEKVALAQDASDVMSATAINAIVPLNCRRIMRQVTNKLKKIAQPPVRPNRIPYTQENLTTALTHLVNCHFNNEPCSLRKAAKLFMDNKYASLTRVWKAHRMKLILERFDRTHCLNFVATIEKPKVSGCMHVCFIDCFVVCLLLVDCFVALFALDSPPVVCCSCSSVTLYGLTM